MERLSDVGGGPLYKVGDLVQLSPATDWFMRGAKYGEIMSVMHHKSGRFSYMVDLNLMGSSIGKRVRIHENFIIGLS